MDIFKASEKLMSMSEESWSRHANPWSVWTRFTCLPLIVLAIWSRFWLGWYALIPLILALLWTWYNPRAFPPPLQTNNWASKGTFGERIFLEKRKTGIASHHLKIVYTLSILSALGIVPLIYGLSNYDFWATVSGLLLMILPKVWFVDRMVWIYDEHKNDNVRYASWLKE